MRSGCIVKNSLSVIFSSNDLTQSVNKEAQFVNEVAISCYIDIRIFSEISV